MSTVCCGSKYKNLDIVDFDILFNTRLGLLEGDCSILSAILVYLLFYAIMDISVRRRWSVDPVSVMSPHDCIHNE